jgi:hypothetical protein
MHLQKRSSKSFTGQKRHEFPPIACFGHYFAMGKFLALAPTKPVWFLPRVVGNCSMKTLLELVNAPDSTSCLGSSNDICYSFNVSMNPQLWLLCHLALACVLALAAVSPVQGKEQPPGPISAEVFIWQTTPGANYFLVSNPYEEFSLSFAKTCVKPCSVHPVLHSFVLICLDF